MSAAPRPGEGGTARPHRAAPRPVICRKRRRGIWRRGDDTPAAQAILAAIGEFSATLRRSTSAYLRERALDLQDIGARLLSEIHGAGGRRPGPVLDRAVDHRSGKFHARSVPGAWTASICEGWCCSMPGPTSHTVILARSFGVPTLVGVTGTAALVENAAQSWMRTSGSAAGTKRSHAPLLRNGRAHRASARRPACVHFRCAGGEPGRKSAARAGQCQFRRGGLRGHGAGERKAIGLFRTEMLFLDRAAPPSEEEQATVYTDAVRAAAGRPVTFRTFDIGGDKPAPYFICLPRQIHSSATAVHGFTSSSGSC